MGRNDYTLGLYEKAMPGSLSWEEKLLCAKECGFDYVEISIDETDEKLARLEMSDSKRQELIETMCRTGISIRSMCLSGHRKYPLGSHDPQVVKRGMEIMEKAIDFADDLGIRLIMLAGYDVYYEESDAGTKERFLNNLRKATEMAAQKSIVMGFETMETEFMNTVEKAMHYVKLVDSPYLQVYPDMGNITNAAVSYQKEVTDDMETGRGHLVAIHLKETKPGIFREVVIGTGHVDFPKVIKKGWELGVRRYTIEMWDVGETDWKETILDAASKMRGTLDKMV